jgi:molecular chaperone DnaJ
MTHATFDPYATLGLRPGADATQVREAYRRLARLHHPDRSVDPRATERMRAINRAWTILSDRARRAGDEASMASDVRRAGTGHRSAAGGPTAQWASSSWSGGTAAVPPYRATRTSADDDASGLGDLGAILLLVVLGPLLFVILPLPFSGLFILLVLGLLARGVGR